MPPQSDIPPAVANSKALRTKQLRASSAATKMSIEGDLAGSNLAFPKISSGQLRAMKQNQRIIRHDACDPASAHEPLPLFCSGCGASSRSKTCFFGISSILP